MYRMSVSVLREINILFQKTPAQSLWCVFSFQQNQNYQWANSHLWCLLWLAEHHYFHFWLSSLLLDELRTDCFDMAIGNWIIIMTLIWFFGSCVVCLMIDDQWSRRLIRIQADWPIEFLFQKNKTKNTCPGSGHMSKHGKYFHYLVGRSVVIVENVHLRFFIFSNNIIEWRQVNCFPFPIFYTHNVKSSV